MKQLLLILLAIFLFKPLVFSQRREIDSLKSIIKSDLEDSIKVEHLNDLAMHYIKEKKYKDAERQLITSLSLANRIGYYNSIKKVHYFLAGVYAKTNNTSKELEHFKKYVVYSDSVRSDELRKSELLNIEEAKRRSLEAKKDKSNIIWLILTSAFILLLAIIFLVRLIKINIQNKRMLGGHELLQALNEENSKANESLKNKNLEFELIINQLKLSIDSQNVVLNKYSPIINIEKEYSEKKEEMKIFMIEYGKNLITYDKLQKEVNLLEESLENIDYGLYKPHYSYNSSSEFRIELEKIEDAQKEMIKNGEAAICNVEWKVGDSKSEGKKMIKQMTKLMLRAFNGEADSSIAKVSWNNIVTMEARINKAHETINKFGDTMQMSISNNYKDLKLKELYLNFELEEKIYKEKEEQRRIKEEMREDEIAQRQLAREMKEAEEEEVRYGRALERAKQEVENVNGKELEELNEKIQMLEGKLQAVQAQKERAISQAQLTKSGYVYIISNIGSFGEHVYKIGMTRRLDPQDRVNELGDASVPFDFDVHGLIYSDNAPELETSLHNHFEQKRINLVNYRTEFFKVTFDEIETAINELNLKVQLTKTAVAKEYRETISMIQGRNSAKEN